MVTVHRQNLAKPHILTDVRLMSVRDARLDDSLTGLIGNLAGLCLSVHHAASPPSMEPWKAWRMTVPVRSSWIT